MRLNLPFFLQEKLSHHSYGDAAFSKINHIRLTIFNTFENYLIETDREKVMLMNLHRIQISKCGFSNRILYKMRKLS